MWTRALYTLTQLASPQIIYLLAWCTLQVLMQSINVEWNLNTYIIKVLNAILITLWITMHLQQLFCLSFDKKKCRTYTKKKKNGSNSKKTCGKKWSHRQKNREKISLKGILNTHFLMHTFPIFNYLKYRPHGQFLYVYFFSLLCYHQKANTEFI